MRTAIMAGRVAAHTRNRTRSINRAAITTKGTGTKGRSALTTPTTPIAMIGIVCRVNIIMGVADTTLTGTVVPAARIIRAQAAAFPTRDRKAAKPSTRLTTILILTPLGSIRSIGSHKTA